MNALTSSHFSSQNNNKKPQLKQKNVDALKEDLFFLSLRSDNMAEEGINAERKHYDNDQYREFVFGHQIEESLRDEVDAPFDYSMLVNAV